WKLETERGAIMDGDKPEHIMEAIPVMGCYYDVIGVRSFAQFAALRLFTIHLSQKVWKKGG
ncbi:N-acetylornithine carbamoyltransferase, partial [termite gut metagenome]